MQIPKKIKVGRHWYDVERIKHTPLKGTMGRISYGTRLITIATHSNVTDKRYKHEAVFDTFWHELTHAILKDMNNPLENNERFVTAFSDRLTKAILSARF